MKRLIVFQFHRDLGVCRQRLELLKRLNPDVPVHGVYGGSESLDGVTEALAGLFDGPIHALIGSSHHWWKNTDLALRSWFSDCGRTLAFDVVHLVQWDLLFALPLDELYRHVASAAVALTAPIALEAIADRWHWTTSPAERAECFELQQWGRRLRVTVEAKACLGPGYALPRKFLEMYADLDVPEFGHDELRLPLCAQVLGFEIEDTGFYRWFDRQREATFNANGCEIDLDAVESEIRKPQGLRVFHPLRSWIPDRVVDLIALNSNR